MKKMIKLNNRFWKNKKILVTGHTGFTGTWLVHILLLLGCKVYGVSLHKNFNTSIFKKSNAEIKESFFDVCDKKKINRLIKNLEPDIIFHLAAQSILKSGLDKSYETYKVNFIGTLNIFEAIKDLKKKTTLIVSTTDKVYFNIGKAKSFSEDDKLGASDPYSASKVAQDILSTSYFESKLKKKKNFGLGVLRAGNIIGGGDMNKFRLIPDLIKFYYKNEKLMVRDYNSIRPWQHVMQACYGYLLASEKIYKNQNLSGIYNIGPFGQKHKVLEILKSFFKFKSLKFIIPKKRGKAFKEIKELYINSNKAKKKLGYKEIISFKDSLNLTFDWYDGYYKKKSIKYLIHKNIKKYFKF